MTTYESLINKANKCRETAKKTSGYMSSIWLQKARELEELANSLLVVTAEGVS